MLSALSLFQNYVKIVTGMNVGCGLLFEMMEQARVLLGLEDYAVNQTTLEEVF